MYQRTKDGVRRARRRTIVEVAVGVGIGVLPSAARAQNHTSATSQAFMQGCATTASNIDRRIPKGRSTVIIHPKSPNGNADTCSDFTWVKAKGKISSFNIQWKGRYALTAWDCSHSTLGWGVFKKSGASWSWVGGGFSYGNMPGGDGTACNYDKTGFPQESNWGSFLVLADSSDSEYRVAYKAWSHDDPNFGHTSYCEDNENCSWPVQFRIINSSTLAKQDWVIWRPITGTWWVSDSTSGSNFSQQWGQSGDQIVHGDFDGDYDTDFAVARITASGRMWYVINSSTGNWWQQQWGLNSDTILPNADFDGDGRADVSVYRTSSATSRQEWISTGSGTGSTINVNFTSDQSNGDIVVVGDYDNDMRTDRVLWRPSTGRWRIGKSFLGGLPQVTTWGTSGDRPIAPDFDGDYSTDIAVWRPSNGTFYWIDSADGQGWQRQWGISTDLPRPGYIDGDKVMDFMIYRQSEGRFYYIQSTTGASFWTQWGQSNDQPAVPFTRGG